jgi:hypothetical protein
VLGYLLHPRDLTWIVRDEVLWATSRDAADNTPEVRIYPTRGIVDAAAGWGTDWLLQSIRMVIEPDAWGEGNAPTGAIVPGGIAILQSPEVHDQIADLFRQLADLQDPRVVASDVELTPAERRLEQLLEQPVSVDWEQVLLAEALPELLARHGLSSAELYDTYPDEIALFLSDGRVSPLMTDEVTVDRPFGGMQLLFEQPLTLHLSEMPLRSALRIIGDELDPSWGWWRVDGQAAITGPEHRAAPQACVRCFRVRALFGRQAPDHDELIDLVTTHLASSSSWQSLGGPGSIVAAPWGVVVSQTPETHRQIRALLAALDRLADADCPAVQYLDDSSSTRRIRAALEREIGDPFQDYRAEGRRLVPAEEALPKFTKFAAIDGFVRLELANVDHLELDIGPADATFAHGTTLRRALDGLRKDGLGWCIRDDLLVIGNRDEVSCDTRIYRLDTASLPGHPGDSAAVISHVLKFEFWQELGPSASISTWPGGLIATQPEDRHHYLEAFLRSLSNGDAESLDRYQAVLDDIHNGDAALDVEQP